MATPVGPQVKVLESVWRVISSFPRDEWLQNPVTVYSYPERRCGIDDSVRVFWWGIKMMLRCQIEPVCVAAFVILVPFLFVNSCLQPQLETNIGFTRTRRTDCRHSALFVYFVRDYLFILVFNQEKTQVCGNCTTPHLRFEQVDTDRVNIDYAVSRVILSVRQQSFIGDHVHHH